MAPDAISSITNQVKAYTQASQAERLTPTNAPGREPAPSALEEQRAASESQAEAKAEEERQAERERQQRAEQGSGAGEPGQRIDRYA